MSEKQGGIPTSPADENARRLSAIPEPSWADRLSPWQRYSLALASALLAIGLRFAVAPVEAGYASLTVFPAMAIAVLLWGFGPGLLVLILDGFFVYYMFMPPYWTFSLEPPFVGILAVYFISGYVICLIVNRMHLARKALRSASAEIARSEARYRSIVDTAVDGIVITDGQGIIRTFNRAAEEIFGYRAEEVLGRKVSFLIPEPDTSGHNGYHDAFQRRARRKINGADGEVEGLRKDGSLVPLELSVAEWQDEGQPNFTGALRDITDRKQAESALRESEIRFHTVFDHAPVGIKRVAKDGRLLEVNSRLCQILGFSQEELLSKGIKDITAGDFIDSEIALRDEMLAHQRDSYVLEKQCLRKDGTPVWVRVTSSAPKVTGIDWHIAVVEDISQQHATMDALQAATVRLEAALVEMRAAKDEAERANRAKSRFLASASHDLRQPAQALVLLHSILMSSLQGRSAVSIAETMRPSLDALHMLLDGLLDISRLDAGVVQADLQTIALGPIIANLAKEYSVLAEQKGLAFRVVVPSAAVRTDRTHIERILRNLVENALRYTDHGKILLGCRRRGGSAQLVVMDSGIGIAPDQQEAVFQEFYQVGNSERDRAKGLGLGLSVVKRLSELLGHPITLRSQPGQGSAFMLDLPLTAELAEAPPPVPHVSKASTRRKFVVLVIDDEAIIRDSLALILSDWGYTVITAGDGEDAVRRLREGNNRPDLILADYRLRDGRTGVSAVAEIHLFCGYRMPTVIITGDTAPERVAEAHRSGFRIAHKPLDSESLKTIVAQAVAG